MFNGFLNIRVYVRLIKVLVCILVLQFFSNLCPAQTLDWSNTQKLRGNSIYTTVIGEDETGIYVFRHRNKFLSKFIVLERYRHNLGLENSKSFLLKNTRILYADINENGLMILKEVFDNKSKTYSVVAICLNASFEAILPETTVMKIKLNDGIDEPEFTVRPSPDHSCYFIFNLEKKDSKSEYIRYVAIDKILKTIKTGDFYTPSQLNIDVINDVLIDNHLQFTFLITLKKNKNGAEQFAIIEQKGDSNITKTISDTAYNLEGMFLFYNPAKDKRGVSGFYTSSIEHGYEGDFSIQWSDLSSDSLKIIKHPFSKEIILELEGEANSQSGFIAGSYQPLKVIGRSDGGFIKVSENSYIQKDMDMMVINGVPSTQGKSIYNYENILVQNFDSIGQLHWEATIVKSQSTVNDGGVLSSVFISSTENSVNILYNDPVTSGGDILAAIFSPDGKKEIKVIAKGEEMNAFIIPAEGKQISMDKIIVPVLKDRKFALLKVTY